MTRRFRVLLEIEADDRTEAEAVVRLVNSTIRTATKVEVVAESPEPGVQAAFIYDSAGKMPCHAVVKKKDGPWSANRVGFCGVEPTVGPVGSIDRPEGGLCRECEKYVRDGGDGKWYVRDDAPIPRPTIPATSECYCSEDD